ncbi:D-alanine aminotransferase [Sulfobacillus acidophilus TPY]|uniref:D-amino-acid transaminase n=1 Tax=Sulfobacillus acidophilus (strain ATCC 700253 / DSM 10332 / NAL) TaxID=679936 RepID=G8TXL8_SULAD|nr:D-alanine aminotransferase [Sulfobacillus acidophilus TPY]AEW04974.1 D-amino-acid transaminase [Sulfobacillus acidophilus DSM 10332]
MRVYLNGAYVDEAEATVSIDDRAFLFADGVYEVVHIYGGKPFEWERHMARLARSLQGIEIEGVSPTDLLEPRDRLLAEFSGDEGALYIQISRGVQKRSHAPPAAGHITPTVLMWIRPVEPIATDVVQRGVTMITTPDDRWAKVWIKTVGLLPNVLAKGKAIRRGAFDAIFVRDGVVTEATAANVFRVAGGIIQTAPVTNYILPGITRAVVIELARELGYSVVEEPFTVDELMASDEVFITGTLTEVLPVTEIDGVRFGDGAGPVSLRLWNALKQRTRQG